MRVLSTAAIACCLLISFTSCSGHTIFGFDVGDLTYVETFATKYVDKKYIDKFHVLFAQVEDLVKVLGEKKTEITSVTTEAIGKIAGDFSAGSGESVCAPGDAIREKEAFIPNTANELGKPRYFLFKVFTVLWPVLKC
jgi:hypothetical protein